MTKITVKMRNGEMEIYSVDHATDPIVCAAISAILETAVYGLQAISYKYPDQVTIEVTDKALQQGL
jgi:hypothetical protein